MAYQYISRAGLLSSLGHAFVGKGSVGIVSCHPTGVALLILMAIGLGHAAGERAKADEIMVRK